VGLIFASSAWIVRPFWLLLLMLLLLRLLGFDLQFIGTFLGGWQ
jgi:hypothetical protein